MKLDRCVYTISSNHHHPLMILRCTYSDGSGSIDREEFLQIPQIATNPLASRMIAIFDEECVEDFRQPLGGLTPF
jgi:hypothetical protein